MVGKSKSISMYLTTRNKQRARILENAVDMYKVLKEIVDNTPCATSENGGYECHFCGGDFSNHLGGFKHTDDCLFEKVEAVVETIESKP